MPATSCSGRGHGPLLQQNSRKSACNLKSLTPADMPHIKSFPPIANATATILILGSMPGKESLRAGQYYAHPRNAFWTILGELTGASPSLPYEARARMLKSSGIALWDVLASCTRHSSLDADIDPDSIHPNDFTAFFETHPLITQVFFNGTMAEQCFRKHVLPQLTRRPLRLQRMPSTSPANASLRYEQKLQAWQTILADSLSGT